MHGRGEAAPDRTGWRCFALSRLGPTELIIILVIVLLIVGPRKLPELGRGVAGALAEFRKGRKARSEEDGEGEDKEA